MGTEAAREMLFRAAAFVSRDKNRKIKIFNFLILRFTNDAELVTKDRLNKDSANNRAVSRSWVVCSPV